MSESDIEEQLRRMLAERAESTALTPAPLGEIVRQGRGARRRGRAALGAGAALLAAVPAFALVTHGPWAQEDRPPAAAPATGAEPAPPGDAARTPAGEAGTPPGAEPAGVAEGPADPERQLLDGITLDQARASVEDCLASQEYYDSLTGESTGGEEWDSAPIPPAEDLRILLAWTAQGDANRGSGPFTQVLAVSADPAADPHYQYVCADAPGDEHVGAQSAIGALEYTAPVVPDANAGRHHGPNDDWSLPFRWADYGLAAPEVERVTVTYAGVTQEAVLDSGYFVAAGIAEEQPGESPVVLGYGAEGEVLYDSREDSTYH